MPMASRTQNRFFRWADEHPRQAQAERGLKPGVAEEFIAAQHGHSLKGLPERATPRQRHAEGGAITTAYQPLFRW